MLYLDFEEFYETNWILKSKLGFSIQEKEYLYPYEREFYMLLAKRDMEEENKRNNDG